jgi:fatty-acyl-CoA synthase
VVIGVPGGGDVDYEQLVARSADDDVDVVVGFDDVCMMTHTSGTTGTPKGVMLTRGNVRWNVVNLLSLVDFRSDDVTVAIGDT